MWRFTNIVGLGIYNSLQIKLNSLLSHMLQSVQIMYNILKSPKICPSVLEFPWISSTKSRWICKYLTVWMDRHKLTEKMVSMSEIWLELVTIPHRSQKSHTSRILLRIINFCMQCLNPLKVSTTNKIYQQNMHTDIPFS
jgi:hypothetical protein